MHILAEVSSVMRLKSRRYVNGSRPHSRRRGVKRRERRKMLKEQLSIQVDTVSPSSAMCPDDPLFVDVTQFDEDPVENLPSPPSIEVLDTDACAKVRFPEEVPAEVLDAHWHHHSSGQGGVPCCTFMVYGQVS